MLLSSSAEQGEIERGEQEMVDKVFDFADKDVADVMVPRPEVVALSVDLPPEEALQAVLDSPYTRYPVYRDSLDEIVGILHVRDLIAAMHDARHRGRRLERARCGRRRWCPRRRTCVALLTEFKRTNQHMAIVIDEYGTMEGIVTLEDLLEEIVGEIEDEFDVPEETVERVDDDTVRIDGTLYDRRLQRAVRGRAAGRGLPHGRRLRLRRARPRRPSPATRSAHEGIVFHVDSVEGQRIDRLTVTFGWRVAGEAQPDDRDDS